MPKRTKISLDQIADWDSLQHAAWLAAKGKRSRPSVARFFERLDRNLAELASQIRSCTIPETAFRCFEVYDPKQRMIHAPSFRDRVLHHAIMLHAGPPIDGSLIDDSFACRPGKGPIAAIHRAQHFSQRFEWYAKMDVRQYFASIDHVLLMRILVRRFKGSEFLMLLDQIIGSYSTRPGCGLPIGALTSQHFANLYLDKADRWLSSLPEVRGMVRYMDDFACWFDDRHAAVSTVNTFGGFLATDLKLEVNRKCEVNRNQHGLTFCGHRIFPGTIKLTRRRQRLYRKACDKWETKFLAGAISARDLQQGYASAYAMVKHADCTAWRRQRLERHCISDA